MSITDYHNQFYIKSLSNFIKNCDDYKDQPEITLESMVNPITYQYDYAMIFSRGSCSIINQKIFRHYEPYTPIKKCAISRTRLTSLEDFNLYCNVLHLHENMMLTSLTNVHKQLSSIIEEIELNHQPIRSNILGLLKMKNLQGILVSEPVNDVIATKPFGIVNNHLHLDKDIMECREELIANGLKEYAKL